MDNDLPIACSLGAAALTQRLAEMRALGRAALLGVEPGRGRTSLYFAADEETRARLKEIVAAEAACCAFLRLTLADEATRIVLTIEAPEGAELVVDDLVAAFSDKQAAA
jgi:hypothetical protein